MNLLLFGIRLLAASALIASARAELLMTLSPAVQNSAQGREIVFSGTLTNTSTTAKLYLNGIDSALSTGAAAELPLKPNSFFSNVPGVLLPGETYADSEIFRVALNATAPAGDYRGTIAVRGGSDVIANANIAATNFVVLSPAVDVQATDPSASEFGPDSGLLTISRTGGTDVDLTVALGTAGTAVAGVDYQSLPLLLTIPAGNNSSPLTLTPIANNIAQGNRTAQLTLQASGAYNLALNTAATVVIHDKPADAWRFEHFGVNANDPAAGMATALPIWSSSHSI